MRRVTVSRTRLSLVAGLLIGFAVAWLISFVMLGGHALLAVVTAFAIVGAIGTLASLTLDMRSDYGAKVRPPGLVVAVAILVSLALISLRSSAPWESFELFEVGLVLWLGAGVYWLVKLVRAWIKDGQTPVSRRLNKWLLLPSVGIVGMALSLSSIPFQVRFELSRAAMEDSVRMIEAGQIGPGQDVSLGFFGWRAASISEDGYVEFDLGEDGAFFSSDLSIVWVPEGIRPVDGSCVWWSQIKGRWWMSHFEVDCSL